jgi:opacity protein-like surface antigen
MKKIILVGSILAACISTTAFGWGSPYLAPSLYLQDLTTPDTNFRGLHPRVAAGYAGVLDFYYLGAEVFFTPFTHTMSNTHNEDADSLRISQDYGLSFIPGILISEGVVSYLRLGVIRSKFRAPSTTKTGAQFGVGLQTSLTSAWSLRGEYIYVAYSDASDIDSPKSDEFGIGLIYRFDG